PLLAAGTAHPDLVVDGHGGHAVGPDVEAPEVLGVDGVLPAVAPGAAEVAPRDLGPALVHVGAALARLELEDPDGRGLREGAEALLGGPALAHVVAVDDHATDPFVVDQVVHRLLEPV